MIIFYSWQSDLPNNTNRGFIKNALENVAKSLNAEVKLSDRPFEVDSASKNGVGAENIADRILKKINSCQIFVADVSIIGKVDSYNKPKANQQIKRKPRRKTPNPNVVFELGYALKHLGENNIILIVNTFYDIPDDLPFDLRMKDSITYSISKDAEDKATERKILESKLEGAIRSIIKQMPIEEVIETKDETLSAFEEFKKKEDFEDFRQSWLNSPNSVEDVRQNIGKVFELIQQKVTEIQKLYREISCQQVSNNADAFEVNFKKFRLLFLLEKTSDFHQTTPTYQCLKIVFAQRISQFESAPLVNLSFKPDLNPAKNIIWLNEKNEMLSYKDLCKIAFNLLITEIEKHKNPREVEHFAYPVHEKQIDISYE